MHRIELAAQKPKRKRFFNATKIKATLAIFLLINIMFLLGPASVGDSLNNTAKSSNISAGNLIDRANHLIDRTGQFINSILEPELKHENNLTSVLVVGIDTRKATFDGEKFSSNTSQGNSAIRNTDTIIQVVFNHETNDLFMISIPRDMGVDVESDCLNFHGSIHWVYDKGERAGCEGGGIQVLKDTVQKVTGIPVHYYGFVTLDAFVEIVDIVGETNEQGKTGLWINNPNPVWEVYPYNDYGWENVYFPQGEIFLNGEEALRFVRSRQYTSDFGRARRQQIFLTAVKDRVVSASTIFNPQKVYDLFQLFSNKTSFSAPNLEEIRAGLDLIKKINNNQIYNIVLDPELGGHEAYLDKAPHGRGGGPYYMVPKGWKDCPGNEFCRVQKYIAGAIANPAVFQEQAKIFVYGSEYYGGKANLNNAVYQDFKLQNQPVTLNESKYLAQTSLSGDILIFDYSDGKHFATLELLARMLNAKILPGEKAPGININKEDIAIVIRPTP